DLGMQWIAISHAALYGTDARKRASAHDCVRSCLLSRIALQLNARSHKTNHRRGVVSRADHPDGGLDHRRRIIPNEPKAAIMAVRHTVEPRGNATNEPIVARSDSGNSTNEPISAGLAP